MIEINSKHQTCDGVDNKICLVDTDNFIDAVTKVHQELGEENVLINSMKRVYFENNIINTFTKWFLFEIIVEESEKQVKEKLLLNADTLEDAEIQFKIMSVGISNFVRISKKIETKINFVLL